MQKNVAAPRGQARAPTWQEGWRVALMCHLDIIYIYYI